jgi:hypothetical protein
MLIPTFRINTDLSVLSFLEKGNEQFQDQLQIVVRHFSEVALKTWHNEANLSLKNPTKYIAGLDNTPQYPFDGNPFHARIENQEDFAFYIEYGTKPYDMKKMLLTSSKVKQGKNGKYLIIPFTHSKESLNAAGLGKEVESLAPSRRQVPTAIDPRKYKWGEHTSDMGNYGRERKIFSVNYDKFAQERQGQKGVMTYYRAGSAFASGVNYNWKASKFEGIVRMVDNQGKTSEYISFRVMSENSPADSWIHPGIRASHIAENTANIIKPQFQEAIAKVIKDSFGRTGIS